MGANSLFHASTKFNRCTCDIYKSISLKASMWLASTLGQTPVIMPVCDISEKNLRVDLTNVRSKQRILDRLIVSGDNCPRYQICKVYMVNKLVGRMESHWEGAE